jgi:hypothetical protein
VWEGVAAASADCEAATEKMQERQQVRKSNVEISNIEVVSVASPSQNCVFNFQSGLQLKSMDGNSLTSRPKPFRRAEPVL